MTRHDSFASRLGDRGNRNLWRLWFEDTALARLSRNGFAPHTPLAITRRAGPGLSIARTDRAACHVSARRGSPVLSYEARDLGDLFQSPEIRVRVHVGRIFVLPSLRVHSVTGLRPAEVWTVAGSVVTTPAGAFELRTARPLRLPATAETIIADLTAANVVFVTEFIGNHRPARVTIRAERVLANVGASFLRSAGYSPTETPGDFVR